MFPWHENNEKGLQQKVGEAFHTTQVINISEKCLVHGFWHSPLHCVYNFMICHLNLFSKYNLSDTQ